VHDVLIDIRRDNPTFGKLQTSLIDDVDFWRRYVPTGFLHGFQPLSASADVGYRIDGPHDPTADLGVVYNDPDSRSIGRCQSR
jgi:dTDP-4-dehydrorhamnose 3,5-epimerase